MTRALFVAALVASLHAAGCAHNPHGHSGELVAEHRPGGCTEKTLTPYRAVYVLHRWTPPPEGPPPRCWLPEKEAVEMYTRGLARWEPIGFQKEDDKLVAVAGEEKIPLEEGRYCWHISRDTEYTGVQRLLHETGENVVCVMTMPFAAAAFCVAVPVFLVTFGCVWLWH